MKRFLALVLFTIPWAITVPLAHADGGCGSGSSTEVTSDDDDNAILATGDLNAGGCGGGSAAGVSADSGQDPALAVGFDVTCVNEAISQDQDLFDFCDSDADEDNPPELTAGMVATAFKRIALPPSKLMVQPPNGRTLVNFATNFYTDNGPFSVKPFRLVGHWIELRVTPVTYRWNYGDGMSESTSEPGAAYPDLPITHTYLRKGRVRPSVDTTYAATYRVDQQGPWRPVDGTVTIPGQPAELQVLTATPTLVGYRPKG